MAATNSQLTTPATSIQRVKYFPLEVSCSNMVPGATYDVYANGVNVDAFCKPYGGVLGAPLTANSSGKLTFQYHMAMPYQQSYVVQPMASPTTALVNAAMVLSMVDPFGNKSTINVPLTFKAGTAQ
jgi:hypothetical protein